jgi:hypothetical protein
VIEMTKATEENLEKAIRASIAASQQSTTAVLLEVESKTAVGLPGVQRVFYRMMSDGAIKLGPGFIPTTVD